MPTRQSADVSVEDEYLEDQLGKLFSDVAPVPTATAARYRGRPFPASPFANLPRASFRWLTSLLSLVTVVLLTIVVMSRIWRGKSAHSGAIPTAPIVAVASVGEVNVSTITPRAILAASTTSLPALATPIIVASATRIASLTPPPTASATPEPTAIPATPTPTATVTPVTPTPIPVSRVEPATSTPVPASSIGLEAIPTPVPRISMPEKAINIVLLGSDQRPYETSWRTDVVIVVSVNPELPSVSMLSIPRDTWLYIPNWTYQRINLADTHGNAVGYPGGGPGLVKATIEYNFGIHVDYFARVNFAGLMRIVDTLGGIDVLLDCPVEDGFPDDPITEDPSVVTQISYPEPGFYHLDGKHALWLARSRKTTSEFARSRRQHRILQGVWAKANQLGFITRLPELWEELTSTVETDLSLDDVLWLASMGLKLGPSQIQSGFIDGRYLTAWVSPGGANVLLPHTEAILEAVKPLFNPYPYKAPQGFNQVEVWNGSGREHWGLLAADKLLRNGFDIADIRQTDKLYENSMIIDLTTNSKGSPLPLLQSLFNAGVTSLSEADSRRWEGNEAPFRLIIGADYQPCDWPTLARWAPTPTPSAEAPEN